MPKKKKKLTKIEKIQELIFTKLPFLSLFIILISILVNIAFLQYPTSDSNSGPSSTEIAKWIENNPKAIIESVQNMQMEEAEKARQEREKIVKEKIPAKMDELISDNLDGTFSTKKPDINIIEFFDYNCGYCKRVEDTVNKLKDYFKNSRYDSDLNSIIVYNEKFLAYTRKELINIRYKKLEELEEEKQKNINLFIDWLIKLANNKKLHILNKNINYMNKKHKQNIEYIVDNIMLRLFYKI